MSSSNSTKAALLDLRRRNRQPSPNFSLWATAKLPAGPLSRLRREPRFFPSALTAHSLKDRPALRYLAVSRREDWILMVPLRPHQAPNPRLPRLRLIIRRLPFLRPRRPCRPAQRFRSEERAVTKDGVNKW